MEFYDLDIHGKLIKKIKLFGLKIREKSMFQNQKKSLPKFEQNEEQFDF